MLDPLTRYWYERLKKETDFVEIEKVEDKDQPLKEWDSIRFAETRNGNRQRFDEQDDIRDYYTRASALLVSFDFETPMHKRIWELHCQGFGKRLIERKIAGLDGCYKREAIGNIIKFITGFV